MYKIVKYRILTILEDRYFFALFTLVFIITNYSIISPPFGMLGSSARNLLSYAVLTNKFILHSLPYMIILSIYIGSGMIGKDIKSNQIYLFLSAFPNRVKYLTANWLGSLLILLAVAVSLIFDHLILSAALGITVNISDMLFVHGMILTSSVVLLSITAVFSIFIKGNASAVLGLLGLVNYNIYAFRKIILIGKEIELSDTVRRILFSITPIGNPFIPSLLGKILGADIYYTVDHNVLPFIVNNVMLYQLIYCAVVLLFGILIFKNKEI